MGRNAVRCDRRSSCYFSVRAACSPQENRPLRYGHCRAGGTAYALDARATAEGVRVLAKDGGRHKVGACGALQTLGLEDGFRAGRRAREVRVPAVARGRTGRGALWRAKVRLDRDDDLARRADLRTCECT